MIWTRGGTRFIFKRTPAAPAGAWSTGRRAAGVTGGGDEIRGRSAIGSLLRTAAGGLTRLLYPLQRRAGAAPTSI
jgi:hypothetical protein